HRLQAGCGTPLDLGDLRLASDHDDLPAQGAKYPRGDPGVAGWRIPGPSDGSRRYRDLRLDDEAGHDLHRVEIQGSASMASRSRREGAEGAASAARRTACDGLAAIPGLFLRNRS